MKLFKKRKERAERALAIILKEFKIYLEIEFQKKTQDIIRGIRKRDEELDKYVRFFGYPRQTGRTTALAKACNEINGIFIVHNHVEKQHIKKKFPTLDVRVLKESLIGIIDRPVIFDHYCLYRMLKR